ncbi:hypothetical protein [Haloarchaeobius sp. HRN-SO-5]|uniref:hypothetical protein n=1 Tax=Haloarchaeobius sp. HRN-SO-5 TaxID=3446118 RepID=UPI003EBBA510
MTALTFPTKRKLPIHQLKTRLQASQDGNHVASQTNILVLYLLGSVSGYSVLETSKQQTLISYYQIIVVAKVWQVARTMPQLVVPEKSSMLRAITLPKSELRVEMEGLLCQLRYMNSGIAYWIGASPTEAIITLDKDIRILAGIQKHQWAQMALKTTAISLFRTSHMMISVCFGHSVVTTIGILLHR